MRLDKELSAGDDASYGPVLIGARDYRRRGGLWEEGGVHSFTRTKKGCHCKRKYGAIGAMRSVTLEEFHGIVRGQGVPIEDVAFRCPMCGTVQSANDLIAAGAGANFEEVEKYLAYSCVGRFTGAGQHRKDAPPGTPCDWTLGGLFRIHKLEVVTPDGEKHPRFEPVSPEEAQQHRSQRLGRAPAKV